jgi:hypothetical protein
MHPIISVCENGAGLIGAITYGYHKIKTLIDKSIQHFRILVSNVHVEFVHYLGGFRLYLRRNHSGRMNLYLITSKAAKKTFSHLGSSAVMSTNEENLYR